MKNTNIKANIQTLKRIKGVTDSEIAKKSKGLVTQSSMSKFMARPEEANPTVKTLRGISHSTKIKPWMLLIPDFPFEVVNNMIPIEKFSKEGYVLLQAFEQSSDKTKQNILTQLAYLMNEYEDNSRQSNNLRKISQKYTTLSPTKK